MGDDSLQRLARAKELFLKARELGLVAREELLSRECREDAALRALVQDLLKSDELPLMFESLAEDIRAAKRSGDTKLGSADAGVQDRIGNYRLLEKLGEGGFGIVFLAEQEKPIQRRVALKVLKLGMDTRQVIARFEAERQALALMDHPGIAQVFDAGETPTGRPYFVMEAVRGLPITEYCDQQKLGIRGRLELLAKVCEALQHAHQKGVIHRDIKPSNVLVTEVGGVATPKIIDFGVAKATSARLTEKTIYTEFRQMIGTPEYMSPEQAGESSEDVDTRTDVYAAGVLMYELLTGTTPFDSKRLRSAAYGEIQRIIREEDPPKPSTRLTTDVAMLTMAAERRAVPANKLTSMVRGELDWIVMKAIEKDRSRRYPSAGEMAADVGRYLSGQAVQAAPQDAMYRLRKFVRRNRVMVVAGSAVVVALMLGLAGTTWQAHIAKEETKKVAKEKAIAEQERDRAKRVNQFMHDVFEGVGPSVAMSRDTTMLKDLMNNAAEKILRKELADAPSAEFDLRVTIGGVYRDLADYGRAGELVQPLEGLAKGPLNADAKAETQEIARAIGARGELNTVNGHEKDAVADLDAATKMLKQLGGETSLEYATMLQKLAVARAKTGDLKKSLEDHQKVLEIYQRILPPKHHSTASAMANVATMQASLGQFKEAEKLLREALDIRRGISSGDSPELVSNLFSLGNTLRQLRNLDEAEKLLREALDRARRLYPAEHPKVAFALGELAAVLDDEGKAGESEPLGKEAVAMYRKVFPGDEVEKARMISNYALTLGDLGRANESRPLLEESIDIYRRLYPDGHFVMIALLHNLASNYEGMGDQKKAEELYREALAIARKKLPDGHQMTANVVGNLGRMLTKQGRAAEAEPLLTESMEIMQKVFKKDHVAVAVAMKSLGEAKTALGKGEEAEKLLKDAQAMLKKVLPGEHPGQATFETALAAALILENKFAEAEPLLDDAIARHRKQNPVPEEILARALWRAAVVRLNLNRAAEALPLAEEAERLGAKIHGADDPRLAEYRDTVAKVRSAVK